VALVRPELQQAGDRPVIKPPVWTPEIPLYFYVGGLAGASAGVGLLADDALARRAWGLAFVGSVISPALLISDLGVPARFFNMLRLFKVTSPMSVGSWVLAGFGTATAPAALHAFVGLGRAGRSAQVASALLGLPLSTYTGALLAATSVPAWHDARRELPFLFAAGAAASAGAALTVLSPSAPVARRLAVGGAVTELALAYAMERRPSVHAAFEQVTPLKRAAVALTATGAAMIAAASLPPGRGPASRAAGPASRAAGPASRALRAAGPARRAVSAAIGGGPASRSQRAADAARRRRAAVAGGVLVSAGALAERWTVFRAGRRSAELKVR
jgi:formate-dependent nitrite reductase membrane component NrfD